MHSPWHFFGHLQMPVIVQPDACANLFLASTDIGSCMVTGVLGPNEVPPPSFLTSDAVRLGMIQWASKRFNALIYCIQGEKAELQRKLAAEAACCSTPAAGAAPTFPASTHMGPASTAASSGVAQAAPTPLISQLRLAAEAACCGIPAAGPSDIVLAPNHKGPATGLSKPPAMLPRTTSAPTEAPTPVSGTAAAPVLQHVGVKQEQPCSPNGGLTVGKHEIAQPAASAPNQGISNHNVEVGDAVAAGLVCIEPRPQGSQPPLSPPASAHQGHTPGLAKEGSGMTPSASAETLPVTPTHAQVKQEGTPRAEEPDRIPTPFRTPLFHRGSHPGSLAAPTNKDDTQHPVVDLTRDSPIPTRMPTQPDPPTLAAAAATAGLQAAEPLAESQSERAQALEGVLGYLRRKPTPEIHQGAHQDHAGSHLPSSPHFSSQPTSFQPTSSQPMWGGVEPSEEGKRQQRMAQNQALEERRRQLQERLDQACVFADPVQHHGDASQQAPDAPVHEGSMHMGGGAHDISRDVPVSKCGLLQQTAAGDGLGPTAGTSTAANAVGPAAGDESVAASGLAPIVTTQAAMSGMGQAPKGAGGKSAAVGELSPKASKAVSRLFRKASIGSQSGGSSEAARGSPASAAAAAGDTPRKRASASSSASQASPGPAAAAPDGDGRKTLDIAARQSATLTKGLAASGTPAFESGLDASELPTSPPSATITSGYIVPEEDIRGRPLEGSGNAAGASSVAAIAAVANQTEDAQPALGTSAGASSVTDMAAAANQITDGQPTASLAEDPDVELVAADFPPANNPPQPAVVSSEVKPPPPPPPHKIQL